MRLLLDTHIALWAITDDARLTSRTRDLITADDAEVFISAVVLWEIAIKYALGRTGPNAMPVSAAEAQSWFEASNFRSLAITAAHTLAVETLPAHHTDPFDRLLVAQAMTEPMHLVTHDAAMAAYGDLVLAV